MKRGCGRLCAGGSRSGGRAPRFTEGLQLATVRIYTFSFRRGSWSGSLGDRPFARPMNEIPKVVFSDSLTSAGWGETTIATGDLAEVITRLKRERSGGYLLAHGG